MRILISADINFTPGTPEHKVVKVIPVFSPQAFYYGKEYPPQFLAKEVNIPAGVTSGSFRTYLSGHGQRNTNNCSEFCDKTQTVMLDTTILQEKSIWRDNCAQTRTLGTQRGTWQYPRQGWCPGDKVYPWLINMPSLTQGTHTITWRPQAYTNHKNTGYNNGSHTPPFYQVSSLLVFYGS